MSNAKMQALALKLTQVITLLVGIALTTYNLFSFKASKNGYYYISENETWLTVGVTVLAISYVIKNWSKL